MTDCASVIACACPTLDDADDFDLTRETRVRTIVSTRPPSPATDLRDDLLRGGACVFRSCDYVRLSIVLLPDAMPIRVREWRSRRDAPSDFPAARLPLLAFGRFAARRISRVPTESIVREKKEKEKREKENRNSYVDNI